MAAAACALAAAMTMMSTVSATRAAAEPCAIDLRELRAHALEHAGLASAPALRRRARLAGLVPDLAVRAGRGWAWDDPWNGVRASDDAITRRETGDVRLTWHLDRLVFDPVEISVLGAERTTARARLELEDEVTARYFRWRRAELDAAASQGAREQLAAEEAFEALDAITGGWFADHVRCRR